MSDFSATNTQSGQNLVRALSALGAALGAGVGASYTHISNAGTVLASALPASLLTVNINGGVAGATGTLYDQDNTTIGGGATIVAEISLTSGTPIPSRLPFGPEPAGIQLTAGLLVVTTGTLDLTVGLRST